MSSCIGLPYHTCLSTQSPCASAPSIPRGANTHYAFAWLEPNCQSSLLSAASTLAWAMTDCSKMPPRLPVTCEAARLRQCGVAQALLDLQRTPTGFVSL